MRATVDDHEFPILFLPQGNRFHGSFAQAGTISWSDVDMTAPQAVGTVVAIARPPGSQGHRGTTIDAVEMSLYSIHRLPSLRIRYCNRPISRFFRSLNCRCASQLFPSSRSRRKLK